MQHNILNHHDLGLYFAGAAVINYLINLIATEDVFLHGLASIITSVAAAISIYFAIRNRKK
jgi:hypothetical protein